MSNEQPRFGGATSAIEEKALRIEVSGSSTISRRAERAIIHVRVASIGPDQVQVSSDVTRTSNDLQGLLKELSPRDVWTGELAPGAAVTHWSMSTLTTGSYFGWTHGKMDRQRTYTANTTFEVKFADFARLGSVATQLSTLPHVSVARVEWRLTDATRAGFATQSRRDAVLDAVAKARDFAAAVGRSDVRPVSIADGYGSTALFGSAGVRPAAQRSMAGGGAGGAGSEEGLSFEPESVEVTCSVKMCFDAF